jgi:predicted nucleic acid-binding protein
MRVEELSGRVLVDTNVLIYAMLKADPFTIRRESIPVIVTENVRDFESIDGITPFNPFD